MNNAKNKDSKTKKADGTSKKAKGGQQDKKPAKAKSASPGKDGNTKGKGTAAKNGAKVFRVDVNKGPVRLVSRDQAIKDITVNEVLTKEAATAMLDRGEVVPSADYFYATTEKALSKWAIDIPESEPLKEGDIVFNVERDQAGEVVDKEGTLRISFTDERGRKSVAITAKWGRANDQQIADYKASQALVKDEAAEVEVIPALTDDEKAEFTERCEVVKTNLAGMANASMVIGENLHAIRIGQLFREAVNPETQTVFKNFGEFVQQEFGLTREYAQNLAQIAGYHTIALEVAPAKIKDAGLSVNATNALVRSMNKQTKELGLDEVEGFEDLRPVISGTLRVLADVAPKNKRTGQAEITPRLINTVTSTLGEIVKSGTVEIEGKQMSIADAAEKGVLGAATQAQVIEAVAEGIKANRQTIADEARAEYERQNAPAQPSNNPPKAWFSGTVPELAGFSCSKHGATKIVSIGSGVLQTKCKCRWRIDAESGDLVCYEVLGKRVKPAEKA